MRHLCNALALAALAGAMLVYAHVVASASAAVYQHRAARAAKPIPCPVNGVAQILTVAGRPAWVECRDKHGRNPVKHPIEVTK